jgi:tetratricopeptide (TPR) repeat protein
MRDASTYTTRGLIKYSELGDSEYALADYDLAIEIDPNFAPAHNCRGLLRNVKPIDIAGALGDYDLAIELDPELSEAFYNRGMLKHRELGATVGALADYDRRCGAQASGHRSRSSFGICLFGAGFAQAGFFGRSGRGGAGSRSGDIDRSKDYLS